MTEIIAIDPGFPGAGRVLRELARASEKVSYFELSGPIRGHGQYKWAVLPAWRDDYPKLAEALVKGGFVKEVCLLWTSPCLQSEMVPQELEYVQLVRKMLREKKVGAVWVGDPAWLSFFKEAGKAFHAPYPATLPQEFREKPRERKPDEPIQASLFGPMHPRKNVLVQALAAKLAGCVVHYTDEKAAGPTVWLSGVTAINHGWMPEPLYSRFIVEGIDIGLQVSVPGVESWSYVCWDHVSRGVPCLSSVEWVPVNLLVGKHAFYPEAISVRIKATLDYDWSGLRDWASSCSTDRNSRCLETLDGELGVSL